MSVAGATIHAVAARRRREAYGSIALALVFAGVAVLIWTRLEMGAIGVVVIAIALASRGAHSWRRAQDADVGAVGEAGLQTLLQPLVERGWRLAVNVPLPGYGDVDALLQSPSCRRYVIDAKMYGGAVLQRGDSLLHVRGQRVGNFDEDLLGGAMRQAQLVAQRMGGQVFPFLCFMQARLLRPLPGAVAGVGVVDAGSVVAALLILEGQA